MKPWGCNGERIFTGIACILILLEDAHIGIAVLSMRVRNVIVLNIQHYVVLDSNNYKLLFERVRLYIFEIAHPINLCNLSCNWKFYRFYWACSSFVTISIKILLIFFLKIELKIVKVILYKFQYLFHIISFSHNWKLHNKFYIIGLELLCVFCRIYWTFTICSKTVSVPVLKYRTFFERWYTNSIYASDYNHCVIV